MGVPPADAARLAAHDNGRCSAHAGAASPRATRLCRQVFDALHPMGRALAQTPPRAGGGHGGSGGTADIEDVARAGGACCIASSASASALASAGTPAESPQPPSRWLQPHEWYHLSFEHAPDLL